MDLNLIGAVVSVTGLWLGTAHDLYSLHECYKDSHTTITLMYQQSRIFASSLSYLQHLLLTDPDVLPSSSHSRPDLLETLKMAVNGGQFIHRALDEEIKTMLPAEGNTLTVVKRIEFVWKKDNMERLLSELKNFHEALQSVIGILQMYVLHEFHFYRPANDCVPGRTIQNCER